MNSVHDLLLDPDAQQEYSFREEKVASVSGTTQAKQTHLELQAARFGYLFKKKALELYLLKIILCVVLIKSAFVVHQRALSVSLVATPMFYNLHGVKLNHINNLCFNTVKVTPQSTL